MIPKYISKISKSQATALGLKVNEVLSDINFSPDEKQLFSVFYDAFNSALDKLINQGQIVKKVFTITDKNKLLRFV